MYIYMYVCIYNKKTRINPNYTATKLKTSCNLKVANAHEVFAASCAVNWFILDAASAARPSKNDRW